MKKILFTIVLMAVAVSMNAQRITRSYNDVPLPQALMELNDMQSDYAISFIYDDLRDFTVTANVQNATVQDAIEQMTKLYNIRMTVVGKTILVESGIRGSRLSGTVIDKSNKPIEYVNIALLSIKDSTFITGGVSNEQGRFIIPCNEAEVIMRMSCIGMRTLYRRVKTEYIGTVRMQADTYTLEGVTVKGNSYIRKEDRVVIIPNKLDVKHAYTGYDLLYNMMIPGMTVDRKAGSVQSLGGAATLYINGVKAEYRDIQNLKPKEVIKIEYFEIPTKEYSGDNASINFIVKKYDFGGYVAVDGSQTVGYLNGDYNVASKLQHGNTSYTLYAGHTVQRYDNNKNHETEDYHFADYSLTRQNDIANERVKHNQQYAQLNIVNQNDKRTLQARLSFVRSASPDNSSESLLTYSDLYDGSASSTQSSTQSIMPSFEVFGLFKPKQGHVLQIRLGGTYANNRYDRTYTADTYNALSSVREDLFSVPFQIKYTLPLKNNNSLTASIMNYYNSSNSDYYGTNESWQHLWSNETLFFLYYDWRIAKNMMLENRIGFSYEAYRLHGNDKVAKFSPRWNTRLIYTITPKQTLLASIAIGNSYPAISQLNSAEQTIDMLHVKRGNPFLENALLYDYGVGYMVRFGRFSLTTTAFAQNVSNLSMPVFNADGNRVVETYYSDDNYHCYEFAGDLTYRPIDALTLRVVGKYDLYQITGQRPLTRRNFCADFYVNYYWRDFALNLYAKTKQKSMIKEPIVEHEDAKYNASVGWHHGNWYAEVGANNFFTRRHERRYETVSDVYRRQSWLYSCTEQQSAYLKLAYSFDFGKKTQRDNKDVNTTINSAILKAE